MARTYVHEIACCCCGLAVAIPEGEVAREGEGSLAGWGSQYSFGEYTCPSCAERIEFAVAYAINDEMNAIATESNYEGMPVRCITCKRCLSAS